MVIETLPHQDTGEPISWRDYSNSNPGNNPSDLSSM